MTVIYLFSEDGKLARQEMQKKAGRDYLKDTGRDIPDDAFRTEKTEKGKPYFPELPEVNISISHSGYYWACAFSDAPVGIDIQKHTIYAGEDGRASEGKLQRMADRFFHPDEADRVQKDGGSFFMLWTAKESYVKYTGSGIDKNFASVSIAPAYCDARGRWQAAGAEFCETEFPEGYSLCVCQGRIEDGMILKCAPSLIKQPKRGNFVLTPIFL